MTKVYCVMYRCGQYEDYHENVEKAFFDQRDAIEYMNKANETLKMKQEQNLINYNMFIDTDIESMTDDEFEEFEKKYTHDIWLEDQHDYKINVIEVE